MSVAAMAGVVAGMIGGHVLRGPAVVAMAGLQAIASGALLWFGLPRRLRWLGIAAGAVLLAGIGWGARASPQVARDAASGLAHAMLYGALLVIFGHSLLPGRVAVVTRLAQRLNPHFRSKMVPYTRIVTFVWCAFAAGQLVSSAWLLEAGRAHAWLLLVTVLHAPMAIAVALLEYAARCVRFPGEHTSFRDTVRGVRASMRS